MLGLCCSVFTRTYWEFFEYCHGYTEKQLVEVCYFWLVGLVFFASLCLVFSVQTQADMMRKGPLTLRALSKLVLMQSLDLVPLFVNLQNSLLISWCSSLKSQPMGLYVISDCIFFCGG